MTKLPVDPPEVYICHQCDRARCICDEIEEDFEVGFDDSYDDLDPIIGPCDRCSVNVFESESHDYRGELLCPQCVFLLKESMR